MRRFFKALCEGRPLNLSNRFRIATGDYVHLSLRAVPFLDHKGRILHWRGVLTYRAAESDNVGRIVSQIS